MNKGAQIVVLTVCATFLASCARGATPYEKTFKSIAKDFGAELLRPPRDDVTVGSTLRKKDTLTITSGCYTGDLVRDAKSLALVDQKIDYTNNVGLSADWQSLIGLTANYERVSKVRLILKDFKLTAIDNIHPTKAEKCLKEGYVDGMPVVASIISIGSIEAEFYDKKGVKIDLSIKEGAIAEVAQVSGKLGVAPTREGTAKFTGGGIYALFKSVKPSLAVVKREVVCNENVLCETGVAEYQVTATLEPDGKATLKILNPKLGLSGDKAPRGTLSVGDVIKTIDQDLRFDYVQLLQTDASKKQVKLRVEKAVFKVENGRLIGEPN
jgi:hypothetical protein